MAQNLELKEIVKAYSRVFNSPAGQTVIADLEKRFYGTRTSFLPGDPYTSARNEGQRSVVLFIKNCLGLAADPQRLEAALQTTYDEGDNS